MPLYFEEGFAEEDLGWFTLDIFTNMKKIKRIKFLSIKKVYENVVFEENEMKTAYDEAKKIPTTKILLGDLPIEFTKKKLNKGFSFWNKLRFALEVWILSFLAIFKPAEEVIKLADKIWKNRMSENEKSLLLLEGRDEFLTFILQKAADDRSYGRRPTVVGVFGAAHILGILKHWNLITEDDIVQLIESYECTTNFDFHKERKV